MKELGEVAKQRRSGIRPEEIDAESPYIALETYAPSVCIALTQWSNADGLASGKLKFEQGDILFGKLRPYFHKVGVAPLDGGMLYGHCCCTAQVESVVWIRPLVIYLAQSLLTIRMPHLPAQGWPRTKLGRHG